MRTEPGIRLSQENLMELLGTLYLSYIHLTCSLYYTNLAYSKEIYMKHVIITLLFLEPSACILL